jgi:hypothetical protein
VLLYQWDRTGEAEAIERTPVPSDLCRNAVGVLPRAAETTGEQTCPAALTGDEAANSARDAATDAA